MRRVFWVVLALAAPAAHAVPWLCTLPDGRKEWSYEPQSAADRNCVDQPLSRGYVRRAPPKDEATGAEFPRIDAKTQKKRDIARRDILERELEAERKALADVVRELAEFRQSRAAGAGGTMLKQYEERIRTHRTNIANLEKEIAGAG